MRADARDGACQTVSLESGVAQELGPLGGGSGRLQCSIHLICRRRGSLTPLAADRLTRHVIRVLMPTFHHPMRSPIRGTAAAVSIL